MKASLLIVAAAAAPAAGGFGSDTAGLVLIALLLLAGNAFFSGVETSIVSANRARLERLASEGRRDARAALRLLADTPGTVAGALVGTNVCGIAAASLTTAVAAHFWPAHGPLVATLTLTPVVLVGCEILPKALFRSRPTRLLRASAALLSAALVVFRPVLLVTSGATKTLLFLFRVPPAERRPVFGREDLETLFLYGRAGSEAPESTERAEAAFRMAGRVLDLQRRGVGEAMKPLPAAHTVAAGGTVGEVQERFRETRVPILGLSDAAGRVRGFVAAKDILGVPPETPVAPYGRAVLQLAPHDSLDRAITGFRRRRLGLGLVRDRDGRTLGVLSPEDVLEEVVGEIREARAARPPVPEPED
ncbi:MAG: CNNM domain-containing protein [Candidatus Eiseniibacteriota bacterium]